MNRIAFIWRSYHFRYVAVGTLLSGALIVGITVFYARSVRLGERTQLDREIREESLMLLSLPFRSGKEWKAMDDRLQADTPEGTTPAMLLVRDGHGRVIYQSSRWRIAPDAREVLTIAEIRDRYSEFRSRYPMTAADLAEGLVAAGPQLPPPTLKYHIWSDPEENQWRVGITATPDISLALAHDWTQRKLPYSHMVFTLVAVLPLVLVLLASISFIISYRALRPIRQLQATAERVSASGLSHRIPEGENDFEFEGLVRVFNRMLERLERSFNQANQFTAAAAHELKTPLAVMQGELERGVQESGEGSPEQERYTRMLDQVLRLKSITHRLLLLATVDAGRLRIQPARFDLAACLAEACDDSAVLAPEITITRDMPDHLDVEADPELLPQAISNLLSNAVIHNDPDGFVKVSVEKYPGAIGITIQNSGPGIPPQEAPRVFERFYRTDQSRTRKSGGSGLGLALARDILRAHGGDIELISSHPGLTSFRMTLPTS